MTKLNYIAPSDRTGYACAAEGYVLALRAAGADVRFQPLTPGQGLGLWYQCETSGPCRLDPTAPTILHVVPEYYAPLKHWLKHQDICGPMIGMTVWETDRLPAHWPSLLNAMDAILVPTEWNRRTFQACGVHVPVRCVPHISQFNGIPADGKALRSFRKRLPQAEGRFVFYSIGAWNVRKGNDLLVRAFQMAFAGRSDVMLILKTSSVSLDPPPHRVRRMLQRVTGTTGLHQKLVNGAMEGITVLTDELDLEEMRALHTLGDCYVSCARGEGWGMGLYEAILLGHPVLAPREGGHRAYLTDNDFPGLIGGHYVAVRTQGYDASYTSDQSWYEVDLTTAAQKLLDARENAPKLQKKARAAMEAIHSSFDSAQIATNLLSNISRTINTGFRCINKSDDIREEAV